MTDDSDRASGGADPAEPAAKRSRGRPKGSTNKPKGPTALGMGRVAELIENGTPGPATVADAFVQAKAHAAELTGSERDAGRPGGVDDEPWAGVEPDAEPSAVDLAGVELAAVLDCAKLDHSDTDNGQRLVRHFGRDMMVLETEGATSADWMVWTGTHWDGSTGNDAALRLAQKVGDRIGLEAPHLDHTPAELRLLSAAGGLKARHPDLLSDEERSVIERAKAVPAALDRRRSSRKSFGVTSKNHGRITNLLKLAAPHVTCHPDRLNAVPNLTAVRNCTLRFVREVVTVRELDPECPDPDVERFTERQEVTARVEVVPGHRRDDLITKLMPVDYDPAARCPLWDSFLAEYLPDPEVRRMFQVFCGLGMTGISLQRVMVHFGSGANGKSVAMETVLRMMGPLGTDLPSASLTGDARSSGAQASPDIAMLYGARCVRVAELPAGEPLKEDLVKVLTGGERMPVRNLFKGFFKFTPVFKAHLSCNVLPRIDGTDNGIWRRMVVAPWVRTIPEEKRRELSIVVGEFMEEAPGILNWLAEGVLIYLREGFKVPEAALKATQDYRDEMDPVGQFKTDCIAPMTGHHVQATDMYRAYETWCLANSKVPKNQTAFGKIMRTKLAWKKASVNVYTDVHLVNIPDRPSHDTGFPEQR